jgi:hypothetical protein
MFFGSCWGKLPVEQFDLGVAVFLNQWSAKRLWTRTRVLDDSQIFHCIECAWFVSQCSTFRFHGYRLSMMKEGDNNNNY